jgi:hypothetical protein
MTTLFGLMETNLKIQNRSVQVQRTVPGLGENYPEFSTYTFFILVSGSSLMPACMFKNVTSRPVIYSLFF